MYLPVRSAEVLDCEIATAQLWRFKPSVQKVINATLRELKGLNNPTIAFHVRGGDLSADLQHNVSQPFASPILYGKRNTDMKDYSSIRATK